MRKNRYQSASTFLMNFALLQMKDARICSKFGVHTKLTDENTEQISSGTLKDVPVRQIRWTLERQNAINTGHKSLPTTDKVKNSHELPFTAT